MTVNMSTPRAVETESRYAFGTNWTRKTGSAKDHRSEHALEVEDEPS